MDVWDYRFFLPLFERKKKKIKVQCYTAIQSGNGLVTTKVGVSLHIFLREKNKDRKKRNNSITVLRIPVFFKGLFWNKVDLQCCVSFSCTAK